MNRAPCSDNSPKLPEDSHRQPPFKGWINSLQFAKGREWPSWLLGMFLALAVFLVYSNTFHGPFQYDDLNDILANPSIRRLWPLRDVLFPTGSGFSTRPVVNLTFALNFATGGLNPYHYHLTNLGVHICASLTLFGVLNRTLALPALKERFSGSIHTLSLVAAACWALHPLLTESVAYITQRYESLMGLFVLLTFYCLLRVASNAASGAWVFLTCLSALLALLSKEVAVSLPILVLIFDRNYMAGSFRSAWTTRKTLYLGLVVAWLGFAYIQLHAERRVFAGFGLTMPWWKYAANQPTVILHYLRLSIWPHPLIFDYFWPAAKNWGLLLPGLIFVGGALGLTIWALIRKLGASFLAASFFLILAPTSSVMPILDLAVEHRMYLPLIPVVVLLTLSIHYLIINSKGFDHHGSLKRLILIFLTAGSFASLGILTYLRNEEFQNTVDLWRDVVAKVPANPRAHHNYAYFLAEAGMTDEALRQYGRAVELAPGMALFHSNYGVLLARLGHYEEALKELRLTLQLEPENYKNFVNLGSVLLERGSVDNAIVCYQEALKVNPGRALPYSALSEALLAKGDLPKALEAAKQAAAMEPEIAEFYYKLGRIHLLAGNILEANINFERGIQLSAHPEVTASESGWVFHALGLDKEAVSYLRRALRLKPDHTENRFRLGWILATTPDPSVRNGGEAMALANHLLLTHPRASAELQDLLGVALAEEGRFQEAIAAIRVGLSQSKDRREKWVPGLEQRLECFEKGLAYREVPKGLH